MNNKDLTYCFLIILVFLIIVVYNVVYLNISNVKNNWPKYRCNPLVMPFAEYFGHDPKKNFNECVKNIQKTNMKDFLQPANYAISLAGQTSSQMNSSVHNIRKFLNYLRNQLHTTIRKIFTVFLGIIQPINEILVKFRDLTMRLLGAMTVMLYMVDGSNKTVVSTWNSDVGGMVRTLCFDPQTGVNMNDGSIKRMEDIKLGDKLENNIDVIGLLTLQGEGYFYEIYSEKLKDYIYVTGSHYIKDKNRYIKVSEYKNSRKTRKKTKIMRCLITSNHTIPIGEYIFWDWEDDLLSSK